MAKYTKEEKQKAIDLYIRYCKQATLVLRNLGILMSGIHWAAGTGDMKGKGTLDNNIQGLNLMTLASQEALFSS